MSAVQVVTCMTPFALALNVTEAHPTFSVVSIDTCICSIRQNCAESSWQMLGGSLGPTSSRIYLSFHQAANFIQSPSSSLFYIIQFTRRNQCKDCHISFVETTIQMKSWPHCTGAKSRAFACIGPAAGRQRYYKVLLKTRHS